ncbi:MAG: virulence RhuM family protein, partial [Clostridiales Family XIII bacterium]|nr:virulence RhuM family protein [Clostridiales Family XIII bacterium]
MNNTNEIVLYQADEAVRLEVMLGDETVWLTQAQMVELFESTKQNISLHVKNIFKEGELISKSVVKESLTTATDGKAYNVKHYNLDVIISVGYRVKSQRGTQFRIWATSVLREYLLKGYALNQRVDKLEYRMEGVEEKIDLFVKTALPPVEGVFYEGQIFDAYEFVSKLVKSAKKRIVLIDNYVDESVLSLLAKRRKAASATIYTAKISKVLQSDLDKHNAQYPPIVIE